MPDTRRAAGTRKSGNAQRRRSRGRVAVIVALLGLLAGAVIAMQFRDGDSDGLEAISGPDPGVLHVHGLGVDPGDGSLYAATHLGLFRIPAEGKAHRVANRYQDTMGFTVVGPRHFLGSGHPDLREDTPKNAPPLLGLIESTDAGETWKRLSLVGEADFHALEYAHGLVYGYDSTGGRLMVSANRTDWETRSTVEIGDLAVSPVDKDELLATTKGGLQRSRDGGRTWQHVAAPNPVLLAWPQAKIVYAVSATGQVLRSEDGAETWKARGRAPGEPEAFLVDGDTLYVSIASRGGIHASTDGGQTWQLRYRDGAE